MAKIRIETGVARPIAKQFVLSGEAVALIARDLEVATSDVDDYECQKIASELLADELAALERVAQRWEELGARLHAVVDGFEQADYAGVLILLGQGEWADGRSSDECLAYPQLLFLLQDRELTDEDWTLFLDTVHEAPLELRQAAVRAIINDESLLAGFAPEDATLIVAALLDGSLNYTNKPWAAEDLAGNPVENHFVDWLRADWGDEARAKLPGPEVAQMNCWQYVLYAAYISGQVSYDDLAALHQEAMAWWPSEGTVIGGALGTHEDQEWEEGPVPRGSLIFFEDTGHVAISLGTRDENRHLEILSLFQVPVDEDDQLVLSVQRTTIRAVVDEAEEREIEQWDIDEDVTYGPNILSGLGKYVASF